MKVICNYIFAAIFVLFIGVAVAKAQENHSSQCSYNESRPISFSDWNSDDVAHVRVADALCKEAIFEIVISRSDGAPIFEHSADFTALTPINFSELTQADLFSRVGAIWDMLEPTPTSALEPWSEHKDIYDLWDQVPMLPKEEYENVRTLNKPFVCVQSHYEGADCYWFNPNSGAQLLVRLSG